MEKLENNPLQSGSLPHIRKSAIISICSHNLSECLHFSSLAMTETPDIEAKQENIDDKTKVPCPYWLEMIPYFFTFLILSYISWRWIDVEKPAWRYLCSVASSLPAVFFSGATSCGNVGTFMDQMGSMKSIGIVIWDYFSLLLPFIFICQVS